MCLYVYMPQDVYGGQQTTRGSQFSPYTMWILGVKLRSSGLVTGTFTHLTIYISSLF